MTNILTWPHSGNPQNRNAAHRRLVTPLDERCAMIDFAAKRQAFYADPNHDNEVEMLAARDAWTEAYQAAQGGGR